MAATIYEVAEKSGFSISTVSRVLNGIPLHSEETRTRVLQAIRELDFHPHELAQGLARRRTQKLDLGLRFADDSASSPLHSLQTVALE